MELGACKPDLDQSELSKESEFEVLLLFMKQSAFEGVGFEPLDLVRVAGRVYYRWLFLSAVGVSLRNSGHQEAVCYFSDRGYLPITFDDCCDFLARHHLKNVPVAAGFGFEMLRNGLKVAQRFHAARLDRAEFAALTLLMILKDGRFFSRFVLLSTRFSQGDAAAVRGDRPADLAALPRAQRPPPRELQRRRPPHGQLRPPPQRHQRKCVEGVRSDQSAAGDEAPTARVRLHPRPLRLRRHFAAASSTTWTGISCTFVIVWM